MHQSSRLKLDIPDGTDAVSAYPVDAAESLGVLDAAALYLAATISLQPAAATVPAGTFFYATDTGTVFVATGTGASASGWQLVAPHLRTVAASSNVTAIVGQLVVAQPGVTVTLPSASANANGILAVQAGASVTGANPAAVTAGTANIYGLGMNGVSSFTLGEPNAIVTLEAVAGNWSVISGERDTGWVNLTLGANVTIPAGKTPQVRVRGTMGMLRGGFHNNSGSTMFAGFTLGSASLGSLLPRQYDWPGVNNAGSLQPFSMAIGGQVSPNFTSGFSAGNELYIDGAIFWTN